MRRLGLLGLMALAWMSCAAAMADTDHAIPPNIIFILTDDQGYGDGHLFGHPYMKTPAIDRQTAPLPP